MLHCATRIINARLAACGERALQTVLVTLTSCSLPSLQGILPIELSCRLLARKVAPARKIMPFLKENMIHAYMNRSKLSDSRIFSL